MISGLTPQYLIFTIFLFLMVWAVYGDIQRMEIPNRVSIAVVVLYIALALIHPQAVSPLRDGATAVVLFTAGAALFYLRVMGGGDVKLMAGVALWAGPGLIGAFLVVVGLVGGLLAVIACTPFRFLLGHAAAGMSPRNRAFSVPRGNLPYGLAIAAGGIFVAVVRLAS